jgi:hypothetical protein
MFHKNNVKVKKGIEVESYTVRVPGFWLQRDTSKISLESFLDIADRLYKEKTGHYFAGSWQRSRGTVTAWDILKHNRWSSIKQRCINTDYTRELKSRNTPQIMSYHAKNIKLEMTKDEFYTWMDGNYEKHQEIVVKGEVSSIDRIDDNIGYRVSNLQLISRHENIEKRIGKKCRYITEEEKISARERNARAYKRATQGK